MKKIMFNEKYRLESAVLERRKTKTRRIIPQLLGVDNPEISQWGMSDKGLAHITLYKDGRCLTDIFPTYQPGETVAIAQRYKDCWDYYQKQWEMMNDKSDWHTPDAILGDAVQKTAGWNNKMFVKADLMPHQVLFSDVKFELLQDISDGDCLAEGVYPYDDDGYWIDVPESMGGKRIFLTPRQAFAFLIDCISGKGTWERNPWVFTYTFELIS